MISVGVSSCKLYGSCVILVDVCSCKLCLYGACLISVGI